MSIVNLTEEAKQHMATMLKQHDKPAIRLGLKGGGCAGFKYEWSMEDDIKADDEQIKIENGLFVVDPASVMYLLGTEMDYKKEELSSTFVFKNPNETERCGCGESFKI